MGSPSEARLTIDLDALARNYRAIAREAAAAEVAPVVKADAYGLGSGPVSRRLWGEGARSFFVARIEEGERLRAELGPGRPATIYVLDGAPAGAMPRLAAARLTPVLNSLPQVAEAAAFARANGPQVLALHIDTGMNRLGLRPEEAQALAASPDRLSGLEIGLVMSHLACSGEPDHPLNALQVSRFEAAAALFPGAQRSLSNSGGLFLGRDFRFDMVRPGISLYGGGPFEHPDGRIGAVVTLEAPILQVRDIGPGESVGYGATFAAREPRRLAIVGAGYADGFPRSSSPRGGAWFDGARRPLIGRVSMDLVTIDVTGCVAASPGAMVELIGPNAPLDEAAAAAGTAAHEILVRLGARVRRIHLGEAGSA